MEKDPEITVITALLGVLASYEWKKLSDCAQLRVLEVFHARRCEDQATKTIKPAPPEQATYRKYEDLLDMSELKKLADEITPKVFGPGKDDYGRKPRPLDITCQGGRANIPKSALTMTSSTSFSNSPIGLPPPTLGLSYMEDC